MNRKLAATKRSQHENPTRSMVGNQSRCGKYDTTADTKLQSEIQKEKIINIQKGAYMSSAVSVRKEESSIELSAIEQVVMQGDLSKLNPEQRVTYYRKVCESSGLNPYTNPFAYIYLNGKLTLYAKKDCTEQLRKLNGISIEGLDDKIIDDLYIVKARARSKDGRTDEATGAVSVAGLKGEQKANAIMKAETKAKRRVTLSISGMGWTDETEVDSIPGSQKVDIDMSTGEIKSNLPNSPAAAIAFEPKTISAEQANELQLILEDCDIAYYDWVVDYLAEKYKVHDLSQLPIELFDRIRTAAIKNMNDYHERQRQESALFQSEYVNNEA